MYHAQTVVSIEYFETFRYSEFKFALYEMYTTVKNIFDPCFLQPEPKWCNKHTFQKLLRICKGKSK
jgi:hypothetical protein